MRSIISAEFSINQSNLFPAVFTSCNFRLTDEFKLLMGEANLAVAKGDRKTAINICLEVHNIIT